MKTIGERVRDLRKAKGFSRQGDLAKLVGVDQSIISDIENGSGFKASVLMALCEHLETTPEFIMDGDERQSASEAEMLALFRNTNDEGRTAMAVMARSLKESYPRITGGRARVITDDGSTRPDTFITKHEKHLELPISGTSKKRGAPREESNTHTEPEPPERRKHAAGSAKARRARGA
ncbi:Helix-turn-helix domain protein [compost metagenome]